MSTTGIVNDTAAATVGAGGTLIGTYKVDKSSRMMVRLTVAVAALTGFSISARATTAAAYNILYNVSADFTAPKGILIGTSGDLTVQGVGNGWLIMDVRGLESIEFRAVSAGTATLALNMGAT